MIPISLEMSDEQKIYFHNKALWTLVLNKNGRVKNLIK